MMEKELETVIVKSCVPIPEKEGMWGAKLSDGRDVSIWDEDIAKNVMANLNVEAKAYVKKQGTYWNIREFVGPNEAGPMEIEEERVQTSPQPEPAPMPKQEDFQEADQFSINAKSSVKLTKNTKGICWEIKVVAGEVELMNALGLAAIAQHEALSKKFPVVKA